VAERVVVLLARDPGVEILDLTGGAPELNPRFRWLVSEARRLGRLNGLGYDRAVEIAELPHGLIGQDSAQEAPVGQRGIVFRDLADGLAERLLPVR
jgi:hypothetical protein